MPENLPIPEQSLFPSNIEPNKNRVIFSVSDTGCGIPKEKQRQVFEMFEKLNEF
ncbi:ATP-binding protein, partial [Coprobacter fastidiosus]|uniref:ATP-binding protein n=1 Tax=Coprobacter fastidiosus TaxID=1099853 RepID=UPI003C6D430A